MFHLSTNLCNLAGKNAWMDLNLNFKDSGFLPSKASMVRPPSQVRRWTAATYFPGNHNFLGYQMYPWISGFGTCEYLFVFLGGLTFHAQILEPQLRFHH